MQMAYWDNFFHAFKKVSNEEAEPGSCQRSPAKAWVPHESGRSKVVEFSN